MRRCLRMLDEKAFVAWKVMSLDFLYYGYSTGNEKVSRMGATMGYMLIDNKMWEISSVDYASMLATALRIHDIDIFNWDKRTDFMHYLAAQYQRVSAIFHSIKDLESYFDEPGGKGLEAMFDFIKFKYQDIIEDKDMGPDKVLNELRRLAFAETGNSEENGGKQEGKSESDDSDEESENSV